MPRKRIALGDINSALESRIIDAYKEKVAMGQMCARFNIAENTLKAVLKRNDVVPRMKLSLYMCASKDNGNIR